MWLLLLQSYIRVREQCLISHCCLVGKQSVDLHHQLLRGEIWLSQGNLPHRVPKQMNLRAPQTLQERIREDGSQECTWGHLRTNIAYPRGGGHCGFLLGFLKMYLFMMLKKEHCTWKRECQCWKLNHARQRLPTPVFWPGKFHGLYSPWGCEESDATEQLSPSLSVEVQQKNEWEVVKVEHESKVLVN